jgi:hypothetical protein
LIEAADIETSSPVPAIKIVSPRRKNLVIITDIPEEDELLTSIHSQSPSKK